MSVVQTVRITEQVKGVVKSLALVERAAEGDVLRRWLEKGAAAEGIDLDAVS